MTTIRAALEKARRARDPRFDGRFFVGVRTTGVYCRPVCPAPTPLEANVRYFPSAAAAAGAGYRPCLRCRPETSPGTPAWLGTSATVSRALRLIAESALDDGGVDTLAERLGVGARHLRRLFVTHLGATPVAVAQTRRLHFAKRLIDETALPFTEVALASGFGSIRRFNAVFSKLYGRTPSDLRHLAQRASPAQPGVYRFRLTFRPPLDWSALLGFLAARAVPGVEVVRDGRYRRTILVDDHAGTLEASLGERAVVLEVHLGEPRALFQVVERARRLFDLTADPAEIDAHLRTDPLLADRVRRHPGLRVPGAWGPFELAVRAVLGQQVSVRAATTLCGRVVQAFGERVASGEGADLTHVFPPPARLCAAPLERVGVTRARAGAIRALAQAFAAGQVPIGARDARETVAALCRLPGIGPWTAEYIALRALGEPDAFPAGDKVLIQAVGARTARALSARAEAWRPWRAYAALQLWQGVRDDAENVVHRGRESGRSVAARRRRGRAEAGEFPERAPRGQGQA